MAEISLGVLIATIGFLIAAAGGVIVGSFLMALLSIIAGGVYGVKYLDEGSFGGALGALFSRG